MSKRTIDPARHLHQDDRGNNLSNLADLFVVSTICSVLVACGGGGSGNRAAVESIAPTSHPLVAQYSVKSQCIGQVMVEFGTDTSYGRSTAWYPVTSVNQQANILVAGMRPSTTYHMRSHTQCSGQDVTGQDMTFTTGALPSTPFPALQVSRPSADSSSAPSAGIELVDLIQPTGGAPSMQAFFTDLDGNPIWYYNVDPTYFPFTIKQPPNGHILLSLTSSSQTPGSLIREVDLAGNTVRELSIDTLVTKVQAAGYDFSPSGFHHDLLPLDNGHLIVLVNVFKNVTNLQGYEGTTISVQGDALIDLDENWNPVWAWNSFDYLDVNRHLAAVGSGQLDWTHSNALVYSPNDGNILVSMRHQSWVLKLDYNNGAGTGKILWHLGYQGDFALSQDGVQTDDPSLWFSFQHFPYLINQNGSQTTLAIWDNGDYRVLNTAGAWCQIPGPPSCYSRATIFQVDESAMVASLDWAYAPGLFSNWGGSIVQLSNGNIEFDVNAPQTPPAAGVASEVQEVTQTSTPQVIWKMDIPQPTFAYRAYRVPSLYPGVTWQN